MTTGNHTVRDIYCCKCGKGLGWKYVRSFLVSAPLSLLRASNSDPFPKQEYAYEQSQKYKEGKYILERQLLVDVQ